jgi:transposase
MIVVGVDVHKHELTAVAVDELGRELSGWSGPPEAALLSWAPAGERLWALEDCRHVSRGLGRLLLEAGERLVRVPPRLTAPPSDGAAVAAASRTRSTRSRSPVPPCANRTSTGRAPARSACAN